MTSYKRNVMVMSAVLAIASVGLMPLMSGQAFADYGYAKSNITQCNYAANYSTQVYQANAGDDVFVGINVPGQVCGQNFTQASITIKDGDANTCHFYLYSTSGSLTQACGSFDLGEEPLFISASIDYGTHTVSYSQVDYTT